MNCKLVTCIIAFFLLFQSSTTAQIGFKAGIGISDIAFLKEGQAPYLGYEIAFLDHRLPLLNFQFGATGNFELGKRFEFQPELLFARKGMDYSTKYLYDDITYKIHIDYLEVPLLFRYKICIKENKQSGFIAGPYVAQKLNAVRITSIKGQNEKNQVENVKNQDLGIIVGYALDLDISTGQLIIDLRGSYSLINMMTPLDGNISWYYGPTKDYARNVNIALTVGYRFLNIWQTKDNK